MAVTAPPEGVTKAQLAGTILKALGLPGAIIYLAVAAEGISEKWLGPHMERDHALAAISQLVPSVSDAEGGWTLSIPVQDEVPAPRRIGVFWRSGQMEGWSLYAVPPPTPAPDGGEPTWVWTMAYPPVPPGPVYMALFVEDEQGVDLLSRKWFSRTRP